MLGRLTARDGNKVIELDPNSLYISLTQILNPGFHWSLYITDIHGVATKHHWSGKSPVEEESRHHSFARKGPAEMYSHPQTHPVMQRTKSHNLNLAFIFISSYDPPKGEFDFPKLFGSIFTSHPNVWQNRQNGISCRTWVMKALEALHSRGLLNLSAEEVKGLEKVVTDVGHSVEEAFGTRGVFTEMAKL